MSNFTIDVNINAPGLEKAINSLADLLAVLPHILHREIAVEAAAQLAGEAEVTATSETESEQPIKEQPTLAIEDVRAAFMAKNSKANTAKLKSILEKYGVKKVTDLEPKDFNYVIKDLEEL